MPVHGPWCWETLPGPAIHCISWHGSTTWRRETGWTWPRSTARRARMGARWSTRSGRSGALFRGRRAGVSDVATGNRVGVAQVDGAPGEDVRPLFDQLAAKLLNLSGAPTGTRAQLSRATTSSAHAFRSYLQGIEHLNQWSLGDAEADLSRATKIDSTFALAYYKLALTRGWATGQGDSLGVEALQPPAQYSDR